MGKGRRKEKGRHAEQKRGRMKERQQDRENKLRNQE
jgi:hypothetical protein